VESYDPAQGIWTPLPGMNIGRESHTATLLNDGKVLVAGGDFTPTSEVYDPTLGIWTRTGNLIDTPAGHVAALLPNGKVLVAGGWTGRTGTADTEIYDPATGGWTYAGALTLPRRAPLGALLMTGQALVFNGAGADLYDMLSGQWLPTAHPVLPMSQGAQATLLPNGNVFALAYQGTTTNPFLGATNAELFADPTPVLTMNMTEFCAGGTWNLTVRNAVPNSTVALAGNSNGAGWEIPQWGVTDSLGRFTAAGVFNAQAVGSHVEYVEVANRQSASISFKVSSCSR
jgi:hypothetical protein